MHLGYAAMDIASQNNHIPVPFTFINFNNQMNITCHVWFNKYKTKMINTSDYVSELIAYFS